MALTADKLINRQRFRDDNTALFLLYLPLGIIIFALRVVLGLIIWTASIILPNKPAVTQVLTQLACWTFGIFVNVKGTRDPRSSVLVANYASYLDSLAASRVLGTISLRKWKVPPFFATALGIRNTAQFIRKQHFADSPNTPVLIQPEGGPTNGKALLQFNDWPFQVTTMVQPVAISVSRPWTHVSAGSAWRDAAWSALAPRTAYTLRLLPPAPPANARAALAAALQVEMSDLKWEDLSRTRPRPQRRDNDFTRLAKQVKEVLPRVPMKDILKDLAITRSVDVTITNFLEGVIPYTPEPENIEPRPSTSQAQPSQPKYITPVPTGVFPKNAKERQLSFQERKAQMIAEARKRYIEKHGLNIALNNC